MEQELDTIYFYSHLKEPYGCFSNFSRHGVSFDGKWWPTTEHYFQAQKFLSETDQEQIRQTSNPNRAAQMGRDRKRTLRPDWEEIKDEVMYRAVLKKFQTHPEIGEILQATGDKKIVENAPGDYYWGCGADGSGRNMLGQILMRVRSELK